MSLRTTRSGPVRRQSAHDMNIPLSRDDIRLILPHREPFLLVDCIVEITESQRIVGEFTVKQAEPFLYRHFTPPQFPATLLAESMAQVGAILVLFPENNRGRTIYFRAIEAADFTAAAEVGDTIRIIATVKKMRSRLGSLEVQAWVGERSLAKGVMSFALG